jgi:hypothetical protein
MRFFAGPVGDLALIVESGDPVPTAPGVTFKSFDRAVVNETGDVVFGATIEYPNETTRYGMWVKRRDGLPVLLAISGIPLETPSGFAEVDDVRFAGPGTFNDLHQFAFRASSERGNGIYIADTRPGIPWLRILEPRSRRDQVTQDRVARISGRAMDETGIASVEFEVTPIGEKARKGIESPPGFESRPAARERRSKTGAFGLRSQWAGILFPSLRPTGWAMFPSRSSSR